MNSKFLSLFTLAALPLFAADPIFYGNPSECCPQPFRIFTMGDYLYLQASETNLEYAMAQQSSAPVKAAVSEIDFPFKDGFRIGGGAVFADYDWQLIVDWTRFYHNFRDTSENAFGGNPGLIALWMHPAGHGYLTWSNASLSWDLKYDTLDLDLVRIGFTNENFTFAPIMGLKRAWINQHFHVRYGQAYDPAAGLFPNAYYDIRFGNDFRGIGPHIGFNTNLIAGWGFSIAASATTALLYGYIHCHRIDVSSQYASIDLVENIYRFKPMAQGLIALEWSHCFFKESFRTLFGIGYEAQMWWGQNQLRNYVSSALPPSNFKTNGALTLKGLDFHARFDF